LAVAQRIEGPALFARREKEIMAELEKDNFEVEIQFYLAFCLSLRSICTWLATRKYFRKDSKLYWLLALPH
jgi:hypothetical protein